MDRIEDDCIFNPMKSINPERKAIEALEKLPEDATFEDAMERLYFLSKVERGLSPAESGKKTSHREARKRLSHRP